MPRRQVLTVLAAGVLTLAALPAVPASAASGFEHCPANEFCVFDLHGGGGRLASFRLGSPDLRLQRMDRIVSSVRNNTGRQWCLFNDYGYGGDYSYLVNAGATENIFTDFDNKASSVRPARDGGHCWG